jgi:hypothetical protein
MCFHEEEGIFHQMSYKTSLELRVYRKMITVNTFPVGFKIHVRCLVYLKYQIFVHVRRRDTKERDFRNKWFHF